MEGLDGFMGVMDVLVFHLNLTSHTARLVKLYHNMNKYGEEKTMFTEKYPVLKEYVSFDQIRVDFSTILPFLRIS